MTLNKIPNKILTPLTTYTIKKHDYSDIDDSYGSTHREKAVINISSGLAHSVEQVTVMHELLHAIELNTGIKYCDESQIEQFAHGLVYIIKYNPELVRYFEQ